LRGGAGRHICYERIKGANGTFVVTTRKNFTVELSLKCILIIALGVVTIGPIEARSSERYTAYDGPWHLSFVTRSGPCDPSYEFDVNVTNGVISHPNLVRFRGMVVPGGAVRASVAVQDKFAAGSGKLSRAAGRGVWKGRSRDGACAGDWTAQRS
jgi:hypothetical protein